MKKIIFTIVLTAFTFVVNAQVGIGTTSPDASAQLDVVATNKGFLPPRVADVTAVANPAAGLLVYDQSYKCMRYYNGTVWSLCLGASSSGVVASACGKIWMDKNLGATQVATSSTDAAAYGDLYQWGRAADGHQIPTSGVTSTTVTSATPGHGDFILPTMATDNNWTDFAGEDNLWQGVNGINNPCPTGYRLPTDAEWDCERLSWSTNDLVGAFASPLKLTLAGYRDINNNVANQGVVGVYYSSTVSGTDARSLVFTSVAFLGQELRGYGFTVRCIKD